MALNQDPATVETALRRQTETATFSQEPWSVTRSLEHKEIFPFQGFRDNVILTPPEGHELLKLGP